MFAPIGDRWPLRVGAVLVALIPITAALALSRSPAPTAPRPEPQCIEPPSFAQRFEQILAEADHLYRDHRFAAAANAIRDLARTTVSVRTQLTPDQARLESLETLYRQLDRAWSILFDRSAPISARFEAVLEARKLDLVLGGALSSELDPLTMRAAEQAAPAYLAAGDYDHAELAASTAVIYGGDATTVLRKLEQHRDELRRARRVNGARQFSGELSPAARKLAQ